MCPEEIGHHRTVVELFDLIGQEKFKESLHFFSTDCITHNPYVKGGMRSLTDAMQAANMEMSTQYPDAEFSVRHILADGDMVAVHTQLLNDRSNPAGGGLRQVHLFRFGGDKIIEYWDFTQMILSDMPNAGGAF